jgi:hypothetical protein
MVAECWDKAGDAEKAARYREEQRRRYPDYRHE